MKPSNLKRAWRISRIGLLPLTALAITGGLGGAAWNAIPETCAEMRTGRGLGDLPLVVLSAGNFQLAPISRRKWLCGLDVVVKFSVEKIGPVIDGDKLGTRPKRDCRVKRCP